MSEEEVRRMIAAFRGRLLIKTPDEWDDLKDQAAECLERYLEVREALTSCTEQLEKAYADASYWKDQAASVALRLLDDGK